MTSPVITIGSSFIIFAQGVVGAIKSPGSKKISSIKPSNGALILRFSTSFVAISTLAIEALRAASAVATAFSDRYPSSANCFIASYCNCALFFDALASSRAAILFSGSSSHIISPLETDKPLSIVYVRVEVVLGFSRTILSASVLPLTVRK